MTSKNVIAKHFGFFGWKEMRPEIVEAVDPFPVTLSWRCIAKGRRRRGNVCIFAEAIKEKGTVDEVFVAEEFTYVQFHGNSCVHRYINPADMKDIIREFDEYGQTDSEEGDTYILEKVTTARSLAYAEKRRADIRSGKRKVRRRGPNMEMRREKKHYFRPH